MFERVGLFENKFVLFFVRLLETIALNKRLESSLLDKKKSHVKAVDVAFMPRSRKLVHWKKIENVTKVG